MRDPQIFGNRNYIPNILKGSSKHFLSEAKLNHRFLELALI